MPAVKEPPARQDRGFAVTGRRVAEGFQGEAVIQVFVVVPADATAGNRGRIRECEIAGTAAESESAAGDPDSDVDLQTGRGSHVKVTPGAVPSRGVVVLEGLLGGHEVDHVGDCEAVGQTCGDNEGIVCSRHVSQAARHLREIRVGSG